MREQIAEAFSTRPLFVTSSLSMLISFNHRGKATVDLPITLLHVCFEVPDAFYTRSATDASIESYTSAV